MKPSYTNISSNIIQILYLVLQMWDTKLIQILYLALRMWDTKLRYQITILDTTH